jgi:hypothetical protein
VATRAKEWVAGVLSCGGCAAGREAGLRSLWYTLRQERRRQRAAEQAEG